MEVGREWIVAIYLENVKSSSERDREHVTTAVSKIRTGYISYTHVIISRKMGWKSQRKGIFFCSSVLLVLSRNFSPYGTGYMIKCLLDRLHYVRIIIIGMHPIAQQQLEHVQPDIMYRILIASFCCRSFLMINKTIVTRFFSTKSQQLADY